MLSDNSDTVNHLFAVAFAGTIHDIQLLPVTYEVITNRAGLTALKNAYPVAQIKFHCRFTPDIKDTRFLQVRTRYNRFPSRLFERRHLSPQNRSAVLCRHPYPRLRQHQSRRLPLSAHFHTVQMSPSCVSPPSLIGRNQTRPMRPFIDLPDRQNRYLRARTQIHKHRVQNAFRCACVLLAGRRPPVSSWFFMFDSARAESRGHVRQGERR